MFGLIQGHSPIRRAFEKYGRGTGEILLDNIVCRGNESSLLECDHNQLRENNCASDHSEDAGVICGGTYAYYLCNMDDMTLFVLPPSLPFCLQLRVQMAMYDWSVMLLRDY